MAKICDRTPCDGLLSCLGAHVFYSMQIGKFFILHDDKEISIEYCPFCGTRLEEVPISNIQRYLRKKG